MAVNMRCNSAVEEMVCDVKDNENGKGKQEDESESGNSKEICEPCEKQEACDNPQVTLNNVSNGTLTCLTKNSKIDIPAFDELCSSKSNISVKGEQVKLSESDAMLPKNHSSTFEKKPEGVDSLLIRPSLVPPDGGWGWFVSFGAFIIMMLLPSVGSCFGIFFSGFLTERKASSSTTAWIYNIQMFIWHIMGPLVGPLTTEFGWRKIGFTGVILVSTSMILSAFSPSTGFLFFSFSFISGLGVGLTVTMSLMIVPQYFKHRQGLANAILMTGICMGQIVCAPLSRFLLDEYGFQGATVIFGGLLLNGLVAIAAFHPVQWHMKKTQHNITDLHGNKMEEEESMRNETNEAQIKMKGSCSRKLNEIEIKSKVPLSEGRHQEKNYTRGRVGYRDNSNQESSSWILFELILRVAKSSAANFRVVKMSRAIIISCGIALSVIGYTNFLMMLPFAMQAAGFSLEEASRLISMLGMSNMITRLIISPLSDWHRFNMRACIMTGYAMVSLCILVFPFLTTMEWMMAVILVLGCGIGANMSLNNLVMIKYLGIENLSPTLGVTTLVVGVGAITFGPFIGFIRDVTGSFAVSMWILAAMLAGSFTLWIFMPAAIRIDLSKTNRNEEIVE